MAEFGDRWSIGEQRAMAEKLVSRVARNDEAAELDGFYKKSSNTFVMDVHATHADYRSVVYNKTPIVTLIGEIVEENGHRHFLTGCVRLNTGGFKTVITKSKINEYLRRGGFGISLYQKKHKWYVHIDRETYKEENLLPVNWVSTFEYDDYGDGMTFNLVTMTVE